MKRRAVLSAASSSIVLGLAGCICPGETWPALRYDITLDEISYDSTTEEWNGQCSVWVSFSFTGDLEEYGISEAEIAVYGPDWKRVGAVEFGDLRWGDVSESNRSDIRCGGTAGTLSRTGEFAVSSFPAYFGFQYSNIVEEVLSSEGALKYTGTRSEIHSVNASQWDYMGRPSPLPPDPAARPTLGPGVIGVELDNHSHDCQGDDSDFYIEHHTSSYDFDVVGTIEPTEIGFTPKLTRAVFRDETIFEITVQMQRSEDAPPPQCDSGRMRYEIGLDLVRIPTDLVVTHLDIDGNELGTYRIETDDGT